MGGGGLERDKLVGEDGVGRGGEQFFGEDDEAVVFVELEHEREEEFEVIEIGTGELGPFGEGFEGEVGAAEADLRVGEEAAAGDVGGLAGETGLEEGVAFAVVLFFEFGAAEGEVVLAEAGAVGVFAPRVEDEVEVADFGVAALEADEGPDASAGGEPAGDGETGEDDGDAAPKDVDPNRIRSDYTDPKFEAVVRGVRIEGLEVVFRVVDHVGSPSRRNGAASSEEAECVCGGEERSLCNPNVP